MKAFVKAFVKQKSASITVEAAIVMSAILLILFLILTALINEYIRVMDYCNLLKAEVKTFAGSDQGEILRIIKVVTDTGRNITDGIFKGE